MLTYHNDNTIKFSHTPVINKIGFQVNQIGPDDPYVFPTVDYTDTDANTIYVDSDTGDNGNAGTAAAPKETLLAAINATTATKTKVVALNTAIYNEDISGGTYTYFQGVYNDGTQASSWVGRLLGYTPADANSIFVAKTGDDGDAGTQAEPKLTIAGAIAACDATHQAVVIMDSGTYEEDGFEFTGNFTGLYAAIGEAPVVEVIQNVDYYQIAEIISETTIVDMTQKVAYLCSVSFSNGNIVYFAVENVAGAKVNYIVKDSQLSSTITTLSPITTTASANNWCACCRLSGGNVFLVYTGVWSGAGATYFQIFNDTMTSIILSETNLLGANGAASLSCCVLLDGKILIVHAANATPANNPSGYIAYSLVGSDFSVEKQNYPIYPEVTGSYGTACCLDSDGDIIILWTSSASTFLRIAKVYSADFSTKTSVIELTSIVSHRPSIVRTDDDKYFITYVDYNNGDVYAMLLDDELSVIISSYLLSGATSNCEYTTGCSDSDVNIIAGYTEDGNLKACVLQPQYTLITCSEDAIVNGLCISPFGFEYIKNIFMGDASTITLCSCEICNGASNSGGDCVAISSDSHVDITYSKIHDCDIGVDTTEDTSDFFDSQFYRINNGYAIDVDGAAGAGAGINIEHCDIFDCYGGIRLQSNDGGEVIKNNIIHDCDTYAIYCDTAVTFTNTVYTDAVSGATVGASVVKANPLYINQGYTNPDDTDLNIKTKVLGYPADSPAKDLADDSRNAGSIDIEYIGTETDWTTITVAKPFLIDVGKEYAGAVNTQRKDGSYSSYKDGQSEVVEMTWKGITNAQYTLLEALWLSESSTVRIYPDPVTYPSSYEVYTLLRKDLDDKVNYWQLARTGRQNVKLSFARASE